jgi:hypothetical protein
MRALLLAGLLLVAGDVSASSSDEFNRARNAFAFGNYREAIQLLQGLLRPLRLRDEERIAEARQLLGVSYYFVKDFRAAEEEFERLLFLKPRHQLDPLLIPPPVIEYFEKVREKIKDRLARLHPEKKEAPSGPIYIERRVERRLLLLNLFPFGVGQFQNRQAGKGIFFLSAQTAMLATNLVSYAAVESRRRPDGRFAPGDESWARNLRVVQIVSLSTLGALVVWGVVDALLEYRPEVVTERILPAPPGSEPKSPTGVPPPRSSQGTHRLQFRPWVLSGGGGLGLGLVF